MKSSIGDDSVWGDKNSNEEIHVAHAPLTLRTLAHCLSLPMLRPLRAIHWHHKLHSPWPHRKSSDRESCQYQSQASSHEKRKDRGHPIVTLFWYFYQSPNRWFCAKPAWGLLESPHLLLVDSVEVLAWPTSSSSTLQSCSWGGRGLRTKCGERKSKEINRFKNCKMYE